MSDAMSARRVIRSFAFLDLCGFSAHMDARGDEEAIRALATLRATIRGAAEVHGVRIAKWLGDGAMLVGMEHDPVLGCALGIQDRLGPSSEPPVRGGVCTGRVILFEGDDYVGRAVNIAARLCAAAAARQILAADEGEEPVTDADRRQSIRVRGMSRSIQIRQFDATAAAGSLRSRSG